MWRRMVMVLLVPAALLLFVLASCTDEDRITDPFGAGGDGAGDTSGLASVSGRIFDHTGAPLTGVQVTIGDRVGFSDDAGNFLLAGVALDPQVTRFAKGNRINTNYRAMQLVAGNELTFPGVAMLPLERGAIWYGNESVAVNLGDLGSGADFADSSFAADSLLYLDRVGAFMAVATPDQPRFADAFPGEFLGVREDGNEVPFAALGVIWTLIDSSAGSLQLADGATATYRLAPPVGDESPPDSVPYWLLDEETGRWHEAGVSLLVDGVYRATVGSLAPICWAAPLAETCEVRGEVRDASDQPLVAANVVYRDLDGRFRTAASTADDGWFTLQVPRQEAASITPYYGGVVGDRDTVSTAVDCPTEMASPLVVTLPDYRIDLTWTASHGDLDASYLIFVPGSGGALAQQWALDSVNRGSLQSPPFTAHLGDERANGGPERVAGRRWYEGRTEFWVHDYTHGLTDSLRRSGARVDLTINQDTWSFSVAEVPFDEADTDTSGWWHVFDVLIDETSVAVDTVQIFAPEPQRE